MRGVRIEFRHGYSGCFFIFPFFVNMKYEFGIQIRWACESRNVRGSESFSRNRTIPDKVLASAIYCRHGSAKTCEARLTSATPIRNTRVGSE